jgi:hypothetical protein
VDTRNPTSIKKDTYQQEAAKTATPTNNAPVNIIRSVLAAPAVTTNGRLVAFRAAVGVAAPVALAPPAPETAVPLISPLEPRGRKGNDPAPVAVDLGIVTVAVIVCVTDLGSSKPANLAQSFRLSPSMQQNPATGAQYDPLAQ